MATVSTSHSSSQSAIRYISAVKEANSRTDGSHRLSGTATKWLLAPTSTPAAFRFTRDNSAGRPSPRLPAFLDGLDLSLCALIIPSAIDK